MRWMVRRLDRMVLIVMCVALGGSAAIWGSEAKKEGSAPMATKKSVVNVIHGDARQDDYGWLREKENPDVVAYLEKENAYAEEFLAPTKPLQGTLYEEMLGRIKETDLSVPYRNGDYFYYSRTEEGKQYSIYCRKKGSLDAPEEITLDLNALAEGHEFMGLGAYTVSDDGNFLAYSLDSTGFRAYNLHVKDLRSGEVLADQAEDVGSIVWAADNRTLFYTTKDHAKRPYRLFRHTLDGSDDVLIHEEKDELFRVYASRTRSRKYLLFYAVSLTTTEARCLAADRPEGNWKVIAPRQQDREYDVEHHGDSFYIRVNDTGRNFRLVTAPARSPEPDNWKEILPHRDEVMLRAVDLFAHHLVVYEREGGLPEIRITDLRTDKTERMEFPEPVYDVFPSNNYVWDTGTLRYSYYSLVTPRSVFDYDMKTRKRELLKQTEVLGGYDAGQYASERVHAPAADGTKIPISLVYRKGFKSNQKAPLLLIGYGSYGYPYAVTFSSNRLSLLDRGFVIAIAHIRGGGEMGKVWHDQGRMMNKMNTFTDFIAAAEHLIAEKYTSKKRLVITGGSAGGLLMGAVANLRPDLFGAVVSRVPFVDVINTMLDPTIPLTVPEYEEWGNPNKKAEYEYMKQYCPYTNLEEKDYPAILVKTAFNDSQVMYWEPAKYVAKLRSLKTDDEPLLLVTNMGGGHGGSSGRYDKLRETALDYAFILWRVGIKS